MRPRAVVEDDPEGKHFFWLSWHFSGYDRKSHDGGRCTYMPLNLGEVPDYYRRFLDPVDIVILKTCPMDESGYFNFSASNLWHRAVIECARMVIVEVSPTLPYVFGEQNAAYLMETLGGWAERYERGAYLDVGIPSPEAEARATLRIGIGRFTSPADVDRAAAALAEGWRHAVASGARG